MYSLAVAEGKPQGAPVLIRPDTSAQPIGLTTSGTLYSVTKVSQTDIHIASWDAGSGKHATMPVPLLDSFIGSNSQPDWSPDGKYLAYKSDRKQGSVFTKVLAIRTMKTGGETRELPLKLENFNWPRWTPDQKSLAVQGRLKGSDGTVKQGIYRVNAETGEVTLLALNPHPFGLGGFTDPDWSPDGNKLYYIHLIQSTNGEQPTQVFVEKDLASGTERELFRGQNLNGISVSPDGRYIVTTERAVGDDPGTVLLIPIAGGPPKRYSIARTMVRHRKNPMGAGRTFRHRDSITEFR